LRDTIAGGKGLGRAWRGKNIDVVGKSMGRTCEQGHAPNAFYVPPSQPPLVPEELWQHQPIQHTDLPERAKSSMIRSFPIFYLN
jgi:hypothetical protein